MFILKKRQNHKSEPPVVASIISSKVLVIAMAIVMKMVIITPVTRLAKEAHDTGHGDSKQNNIAAESSDDIGRLVDSFHRMQTSLRVAF